VTSLGEALRQHERVALMAHIHGLALAGILSSEEARRTLDALAGQPPPPDPLPRFAGEGEQLLPSPVATGEGLGEGATPGHGRLDLAATAFRLWAREAILDVGALLVELRQALTDFAARSRTALAPGVEPPVLLGHYLLAYVEQFYRDGNRLKEVYVRADILPLGAGDGAGVEVVLDRGAMARLLGMHANTRNSVDGATDRDFAIEGLAALAMIGARVVRLVGDPACGFGAVSGSHPLALASATADDWRIAVLARVSATESADDALDAIDAALFESVERTQAALREVVSAVQAASVAATETAPAPAALDRFISRGGTAPAIVAAAIDDTHGRIDTYRQWLAERRAAHPTVEALRTFPSDRNPTLLPHGPAPGPRA
jgi:hypothetical protein